MEKETIAIDFSIAADSKTGDLRIIATREDGSTFVYNSIRDFLVSYSEDIYDTNIIDSIDVPENNLTHEQDKRRFRISTTIEQID